MRTQLIRSNITLVLLSISLSGMASATAFYVNNRTGFDDYDGMSPTVGIAGVGPKLTIAGAIAAAANGDIISVAYTGLAYGDLNTNGKALVFNTSGGIVTLANLIITDPVNFVGPYALDSTGTLTLSASITNANNITIQDGCTVIRGAGSLDNALVFAGIVDVKYYSTSLAADIITGKEIPVDTSKLHNLIVDVTAGTGTKVKLNSNIKVKGAFTLQSGIIDLSNGGAAYTLTVIGATTLTSGTLMTTTTGGTLVAQSDVNAAGVAFGATVQMAFTGAGNQTVTIPTGGASISNITINKTAGTNSVTVTGGDLTCSGVVAFNNGLIKTGATNALVLTNGAGASTAKGYVRSLAVGGTSHVVGNVKQNLQFSTLIAYARNEFPVGDTVNYRPVALTFLSTSSGRFGIFATVSHTNSRPTGTAGLPIVNGIAAGVDLAKYAGFFWSIKTDTPINNTPFNLDLTAAGDPTLNLADVGTNQVKIIRRSGIATDVQNQWNLQGARDSYDNVVSADIPTVTAVNATGGLSSSGAIFTYGLKTSIFPRPIPDQELLPGDPVDTLILSRYIGGNIGTMTFTAQSSNSSVATVSVSGDTLMITPVSAGSAVIFVTAIDADGSQISTTFNVIAGCTCASTIYGTVTYANVAANPMSGVTVKLTLVSGTVVTAVTNATGAYSIVNVPGGNYTLTATKTGTWGGVTGADAQAIAKHAAGITLLTGLSFQAADVNNSGTISAADAQLLVRRAVGLDTSFTAGDWIFSSQTVKVRSSNLLVNVTGLAVGDVNASYTP